jgi:hypothetical protein
MSKVQTTLQSLVLAQPGIGAAAIVDGQDSVVLSTSGSNPIEIFSSGGVQLFQPDTPVAVLDDAARQAAVLRDALAHAEGLRREQLDEHGQVLANIRQYAINRHVEGEFCREGLNAFLQEFGLAEYTD